MNSRVRTSDEVAMVKGDRAGLCKRWLMGSLESLFSQSNEVRLPGEEYEGQARRLRWTARSPRSTSYGEEGRDGQGDSVVTTPILSVCHGGALKDNQIR